MFYSGNRYTKNIFKALRKFNPLQKNMKKIILESLLNIAMY